MKQKVVIKVCLNGKEKGRAKAMKTAAGLRGVVSVAFQGEYYDEIVVTGDGLDLVHLTLSLRKKVGFADILSVSPVPVDKEKQQPNMTCEPPGLAAQHNHIYPPKERCGICSIM